MTQSHLELLPEHFARLRKEAGLSQADMGSQLGVSQSAISQVERGRRNPSLQLLSKAASVLGVSLVDLLAAPSATAMTNDETELLGIYRSLEATAHGHLRAFAEFLSQRPIQE